MSVGGKNKRKKLWVDYTVLFYFWQLCCHKVPNTPHHHSHAHLKGIDLLCPISSHSDGRPVSPLPDCVPNSPDHAVMTGAPREPLQEPQSRIRVWTVPVSCPSQQRIPAPSSPLQWRQSLPRTHCHSCRWAARAGGCNKAASSKDADTPFSASSLLCCLKSKLLSVLPLLLFVITSTCLLFHPGGKDVSQF